MPKPKKSPKPTAYLILRAVVPDEKPVKHAIQIAPLRVGEILIIDPDTEVVGVQ